MKPATDATDPWGGANPDDADFKDCLHERYHVLRQAHPVHRTPRGTWRLTRYDDCVQLLKRSSAGVRTSSGMMPFADESKRPRAFMLEQDPPNHTRLRALVQHAFTPGALRTLESKITQTTRELLDAVADRDRFDIVETLALPLPSAMICDMLGVPLDDRSKFVSWTADATYVLLGPFASPDQRERATAAVEHLEAYLSGLIEERRADPRDDLLTVLIRAEEHGDRLSNEELLQQSFGLLVAGFETTTGLIANGVRQFLLHPDQIARLRADPTLINSAVEECLRCDGPIVGTPRFLHEDCEFGGHPLAKDSLVLAVIIAANRDPAQFEDPDRFDIGRTPNRHLAFGGGIHHCLGAQLARIEGRAAFSALFERFDNLRLESETVTWGRSLFRVPGELWVTRS